MATRLSHFCSKYDILHLTLFKVFFYVLGFITVFYAHHFPVKFNLPALFYCYYYEVGDRTSFFWGGDRGAGRLNKNRAKRFEDPAKMILDLWEESM